MHNMYFFFIPFIKSTDTKDKFNVKGCRDDLEYMMQNLLGKNELS